MSPGLGTQLGDDTVGPLGECHHLPGQEVVTGPDSPPEGVEDTSPVSGGTPNVGNSG